jgi:hypothetical protein
MLRQPEGATVDEVASVTGWQCHTVRGVFSGTLKKKLGLALAERGAVRQRFNKQVVKKHGSRQYGGGIAHGTNCRVELR